MIITDVKILLQAREDLHNGRTFYDEIEQGVGSYFFDTLISDIESLYLFAGIHLQYSGLYKMLSKRFPFAIYYLIDQQIAIVVAVLDLRRNPAWIRKNLKSRQ